MTTATKNPQHTLTEEVAPKPLYTPRAIPEVDEGTLQWIEAAILTGKLNAEDEAKIIQIFELEDRIAAKRRKK